MAMRCSLSYASFIPVGFSFQNSNIAKNDDPFPNLELKSDGFLNP